MAQKTLKDAVYETLNNVHHAGKDRLKSLRKAVKSAQSGELKAEWLLPATPMLAS